MSIQSKIKEKIEENANERGKTTNRTDLLEIGSESAVDTALSRLTPHKIKRVRKGEYAPKGFDQIEVKVKNAMRKKFYQFYKEKLDKEDFFDIFYCVCISPGASASKEAVNKSLEKINLENEEVETIKSQVAEAVGLKPKAIEEYFYKYMKKIKGDVLQKLIWESQDPGFFLLYDDEQERKTKEEIWDFLNNII